MSNANFISELPRTLMWVTPGNEIRDVELDFTNRVSEALSVLFSRLSLDGPELEKKVIATFSRLPNDIITKIVLAPNVSQRLLRPEHSSIDVGNYLLNSLLIEIDEFRLPNSGPKIWSALGNKYVFTDGRVVYSSALNGRVALDLESPDSVSLGSDPPAEAVDWSPLSDEDQRMTIEKLNSAHVRVCEKSESLRALMDSCAKVVVMRQTERDHFSSFSSCDFVGRVSLVNPHLVNELAIMEALVHEATHSMLYMHDPRDSWGLHRDNILNPGTIVSPWSGRELPFCAFIHACFVWYGILFFWGRMLQGDEYYQEAMRKRVARASIGFTRGPLIDLIGIEQRKIIQPVVVDALIEAQEKVLAMVE